MALQSSLHPNQHRPKHKLSTPTLPPDTPVLNLPLTVDEPVVNQQMDATPPPLQISLTVDTGNDPWGDIGSAVKPQHFFRVLSKNTGTINLSNLDITAITQELLLLGTSVFAAQETNVHWDPTTL